MLTFPAKGRSKKEVLAEMRVARDPDVQWCQGRAFGVEVGFDRRDLSVPGQTMTEDDSQSRWTL
jgi:hypothetical protein